MIRASILETQGRCTPLLLSKELLKQLNCVLDLANDRVLLFGRWISLMETEKSHYGLRCFDFGSECFSSDEKIRIATSMSKEYHIDELEHNIGLRENQRQPADPSQLENNMANPELCKMLENLQRHYQPQGNMEWLHSDRELDQMPDMDKDGKNMPVEGQTIIRDRQVWEEQAGAGGGGDLHPGQELCQLDSSTHPDNQLHRDAAAEGLCSMW